MTITQRAFIGLSIRAKINAGSPPINGPIYGMISANIVIIPITSAKSTPTIASQTPVNTPI